MLGSITGYDYLDMMLMQYEEDVMDMSDEIIDLIDDGASLDAIKEILDSLPDSMREHIISHVESRGYSIYA